MSISSVQFTSWLNPVSQVNSYEKNKTTSTSGTRADRVSISNEAMEAYMTSNIATSKSQKTESYLNSSQQSILDSVREGTYHIGHSKPISKSMFAMLLESLFMAELEECGALGGNKVETSVNGRQTSEGEISRPQPNKAKSGTPLEDGDKVAQIKKILADFAKGKADLSDISRAIGGGGKNAGKMESSNAASKGNDDKNKIA